LNTVLSHQQIRNMYLLPAITTYQIRRHSETEWNWAHIQHRVVIP